MTFEEKMELTETEKIKFYIGAYKTADIEESVKKTATKKTRKRNVEFEVTLSSALDTVIERTEGGLTRKLIIMPSQDKYVVMEGSTIQKLEDMSYNAFLAFFNGFPSDGLAINNIVFDKISKDDAADIYGMATSERGPLHDGMMSLPIFKKPIYIKKFLADNPKLWKLITTKTPILTGSNKYGAGFLCAAKTFLDMVGYDAARYFVESYTKSSMSNVDGCGLRHPYFSSNYYDILNDVLAELLTLASFDARRLIEYLCFDLYAQGMEEIHFNTYADFIKMSIYYYGGSSRIPDKYPKALITEHDIISLKYRQAKQEIDERAFKDQFNKFKKEMEMNDETTLFKYKNIIIRLPEEPRELVEEGQNLGHCVGSYVDRVISGDCLIVFARYKNRETESYLTIELRKLLSKTGKMIYQVAQVQGNNKRTTLTEDEIELIKALMEEKKFVTSNRNIA